MKEKGRKVVYEKQVGASTLSPPQGPVSDIGGNVQRIKQLPVKTDKAVSGSPGKSQVSIKIKR